LGYLNAFDIETYAMGRMMSQEAILKSGISELITVKATFDGLGRLDFIMEKH